MAPRSKIFLCIVSVFVTIAFVSCGDDNPVKPDPEPVEDPLELSMNRTDWHLSAKPPVLDDTWARGKVLWHMPRELTPYDYIYDDEAPAGQGAVSTFRVVFRPNYALIDDGMTPPETSFVSNSWGGITTVLRESNLSDVGYLQFRARASAAVVIHFDLGRISEDVNGDGYAFSEDLDMNGEVDETEDVGLDGLADEDEPGYDPEENPDPHGDNWYFEGEGKCPLPPTQCQQVNWDEESVRYEWLNGTEGNIDDCAHLGLPDREFLTNLGFDLGGPYFSYRLDISEEDFMLPGSENIHGWASYRIPLRQLGAVDTIVYRGGVPSFDMIKHLRVWFETVGGRDSEDTLEIADWSFVEYPENTLYIRDYEYAESRIFDLGLDGDFGTDDTVTELLVYQEDTHRAEDSYPAKIYVDPDNPGAYADENIGASRVAPLSPDEYGFYNDHTRGSHYVVFDSELYQRRAIGVFMIVSRAGTGVPDTIGDISGDTLELKMLQHNSFEESSTVWDLMWRNCYSIPKGLSINDVDIDIFYGLPGTEGTDTSAYGQPIGFEMTDYVSILGLDQYNVQGQRIPDHLVDDRIEVFRPDWGLLIFPHREPFASDTTFLTMYGYSTPVLSERIPALYGDDMSGRAAASRYYIRLRISTP